MTEQTTPAPAPVQPTVATIMLDLRDKIAAWFKSKGGLAHVAAATFGMLILSYAKVPAFHDYVNHLHSLLPAWLQEASTVALAWYAWYKTQKPSTS